MGISDVLGAAVSPLASVMGGLTGAGDLQAAQRQQALATQEAINLQRQQFQQAARMAKPWMERGREALGQIQESIAPDSALGSIRSDLVRRFMGRHIGAQGFDPATTQALTGDVLRRTGVQEEESRRGRLQDVLTMGAGQQAAGIGLAGAQGRTRAAQTMAAAAAQGDILAQQAANRQAMLGAALYGGQRIAGEYITGRAAERYGGIY
jgi:hypothetical protein